MKMVRDILATKGIGVVSIGEDALVVQALVLMAEKNIGAVLVTKEGGLVSGIFSERDFARKIIVKGRTCDTTKVGELMTANPITVEPTTSIAVCMNLMTTHKFRHIPVVQNGKSVGVISIGDVVKALIDEQGKTISEQAFEIGQLERANMGVV